MVRIPKPSKKLSPQSFHTVMVGDFSDKLLIPPDYAKHVRGTLPHVITLTTSDGKKEKVIMSEFKNNIYFKAGWSDFVQDKSIKSGNFLVFYNVAKFEFNVSIFRCITGCEDLLLCKNDVNVIDIDSDDSETGKYQGKCAKVPKAMPMLARQGTLKAADKFVSKHPFFKVILTGSYVKWGYVYVPVSFMNEHLARKDQNVMLQTAKKNSSWKSKIVVDRKQEARITQGWRAFVRDNNLRKGDICVFELIERGQTILRVSIFR